MAKDVNIHVRAQGTEQTKQQLDSVGKGAKQLGTDVKSGQQGAGQATDETTKQTSRLGRAIERARGQVAGFVGALLGIAGVQRTINWLISKLERVQQIQKDIYQQSLSLTEVGQALEFQTGTQGRQQFWSKQAVDLQKAGGLGDITTAQQMLVSMDIALADRGGIKAPEVTDLARQLAPFVGAAGLGPAEVSKLFEFAGTAGVEPDPDAYKDYFAKLTAGYTASKATDFGQFMMGLQKGGTAYMSMGGSLEEAISAFSSARAVVANESLAANLIEQAARLSGGAYEKPREAIEESLGIEWPKLSMDKRMAALLEHTRRIPEESRGAVMAEQGFPAELITQVSKMVSPEARRTMAATRQKVAEATGLMIDDMTESYLDSLLAKERSARAATSAMQIEAGPDFADWQRRLELARKTSEVRAAEGGARDTFHPYAVQILALEELASDIRRLQESSDEATSERLDKLAKDVESTAYTIREDPISEYFARRALRRGPKFTERLSEIIEPPSGIEGGAGYSPAPAEVPAPVEVPVMSEPSAERREAGDERRETRDERRETAEQAAPVVMVEPQKQETPQTVTNVYHNIDNSTRYYPRFGDDERGPRF